VKVLNGVQLRFSEHYKGPPGGEFIYHLSNYQLFTDYFLPCSPAKVLRTSDDQSETGTDYLLSRSQTCYDYFKPLGKGGLVVKCSAGEMKFRILYQRGVS
jgi:hypothetical protein